MTMTIALRLCLSYFLLSTLPHFLQIKAKRHSLTFDDESRRNILISNFGYGYNGTLDFALNNFTVPEAVIKQTENINQDKLGSIGFTLSKGKQISHGISTNPHICQLEQQDQGIDALFLVFNFPEKKLFVIRSGSIQNIKLCRDTFTNCSYAEEGETRNTTTTAAHNMIGGFFENLFGKDARIPYLEYIPLTFSNGQYSAQFGIRFNQRQSGFYYLYYHNCFNYREHGFSNRVAVDINLDVVETNVGTYLSLDEIPKPTFYIYMAFLFALATILWANVLCRSEAKSIYKIHYLMLVLVILKAFSLFFHGINYYFVSIYGHQRQLWAIIYYITHLFKGALLFGTIALIGTGYTFFKNFLTERDRRLFMFVIPIQVLDNVTMIIIDESEFGDQRYTFWLEIFVFLDFVCCMAIILPVIWSIKHLQEGAKTDGKVAFNLDKLRLFRHFYIIIIAYIYSTRVIKVLIEALLPEDKRWVSELIVELSTLFFFCLVGFKFRPLRSNPYLQLAQDGSNSQMESGVALTTNGLFEKITRLQRISVQDEMDDLIDQRTMTEDEADDVDNTLLPKTGRDMGLLTP